METLKTEHVKVVMIGAGGTGLYMADCIRRAGGFEFGGFLDDDVEKQSLGYEGLQVLGDVAKWETLDEEVLFLSSLYDEKKMGDYLGMIGSLGIPDPRWAVVVDPAATVCSGVNIGRGCFIGPGCVIEPCARLGWGCALLGNVYVSHHSVLRDYVVCANSVSIAGGVNVGRGVFVGANSSIRQYLTIGEGATVGMGSVVTGPVSAGSVVVGNPAKPIERKVGGLGTERVGDGEF